MKKIEKILFVYSIVAVTVLLITFGIFEPKPINLISTILLSPILLYFWIRLTSPEKVSAEKWAFRFLISIAVFCLLGLYGLQLLRQETGENVQLKSQLADQQLINETLKEENASISAQLDEAKKAPTQEEDARGESITDLIYGSTEPTNLKQITGKDNITTINVYEEPSASSDKIGSLDGTAKYIYLEKNGTWYNLILSDSLSGWVSANQVQEVQ